MVESLCPGDSDTYCKNAGLKRNYTAHVTTFGHRKRNTRVSIPWPAWVYRCHTKAMPEHRSLHLPISSVQSAVFGFSKLKHVQ